DAVKALALAYRAIALACVGVNGESNLGFDLSNGSRPYTYFTAPAGPPFIWRLFRAREEGGGVGGVDSARLQQGAEVVSLRRLGINSHRCRVGAALCGRPAPK